MNKNIMTRDIINFMGKAIHISGEGIVTTQSDFSLAKRLYVVNGTRKLYNYQNGIYYFQNEQGGFLLPNFKELPTVLVENGYFLDKSIEVPCSDGSYPVNYQEYWSRLKKEVKDEKQQAFVSACQMAAKEKCIKHLPEDFILDWCIEIPPDGIEFENRFGKCRTLVPNKSPSMVGTYYCHNHKVSFMDMYGKNYLTMSRNGKAIETLVEAGFTEQVVSNPIGSEYSPSEKFISTRLRSIAKSIKPLPKVFLDDYCIEIPCKGIKFKSVTGKFKEIYRHKKHAVGLYTVNHEGVITFCDAYGKSYLASSRGGKTLYLLTNAGFKEGNLYCPISIYDTPTKTILRVQWREKVQAPIHVQFKPPFTELRLHLSKFTSPSSFAGELCFYITFSEF